MAIRLGATVAGSRAAGDMNHVWIITLILTISFSRYLTGCQVKPNPFEKISIVDVTKYETVIVSCGDQGKDSSTDFELFRFETKIASSDLGDNQTMGANRTIDFEMASGNPQFRLHGPMVNRTGLYTCVPDNKSLELGKHTIVHEKETLCSPSQTRSCSPASEPWSWPAGFVLLIICCLVITGIAIRIGHKLNSKDSSQNDYINMKPRGVTSHRKAQQSRKACGL
ncbi:uncharacterized protein LOC125725210 [Brienomyrus brachyistius]|uniref:uncharacterized protein LOC125725210 n=1 Tax=Brienomyrus brachyistius TaxID=42636 RepID=UPI0020B3FEAB|nr:uncharacterized protein LOC125725210 [Brienomyrus brachyistius]